MNNITDEEKKVVDELKRRTINDVTPKMLEDVTLFYRFSKARDFNLEEAEKMLRKHIAWRKEMQMDTILTDYEPPEICVKYTASTFLSFDKEGSVVRYQDCGGIDTKNLWNLVKKIELAKYVSYIIEKDRNMFIKEGKNVGQPLYTTIYDFDGFHYSNAMSVKTAQNVIYLMKMFVDNFPETIKHFFVINAPGFCTWLFNAVKPVLPGAFLQKVGIYGTDGWKEELLKLIDADDLPAFLGGTKTDPDGNPLCETFVLRGRPIPNSYYKSKGSKKLSLSSDVEKLIVKPFSQEEITFEIKQSNSYLEWEFETKNNDIDFSLLFREESSADFEPIEIISKKRISTSDETNKGRFKCKKIGMYTMVFDNSYSWLHSKEVYYRVEIKDPKNDEVSSLA